MQEELLKKILIDNKIVDEKKFTEFKEEAKKNSIDIIKYLQESKVLTDDILFQGVASYYKLPFIDLKNQVIRKDILNLIPETVSQVHKIIAFDKSAKEYKIATTDPQNLQIIEFIKKNREHIIIFILEKKSRIIIFTIILKFAEIFFKFFLLYILH